MALLKKENKPKVTKFKGKEIIFKIGLTTKNKIDNANPPMAKVNNPPDTFSPGTIWAKINKEAALKRVFLNTVFIIVNKCYQIALKLSIKQGCNL